MDLLWRLINGGGPRGLQAKVVMVLIGTNDVFQALESYFGEVGGWLLFGGGWE